MPTLVIDHCLLWLQLLILGLCTRVKLEWHKCVQRVHVKREATHIWQPLAHSFEFTVEIGVWHIFVECWLSQEAAQELIKSDWIMSSQQFEETFELLPPFLDKRVAVDHIGWNAGRVLWQGWDREAFILINLFESWVKPFEVVKSTLYSIFLVLFVQAQKSRSGFDCVVSDWLFEHWLFNMFDIDYLGIQELPRTWNMCDQKMTVVFSLINLLIQNWQWYFLFFHHIAFQSRFQVKLFLICQSRLLITLRVKQLVFEVMRR